MKNVFMTISIIVMLLFSTSVIMGQTEEQTQEKKPEVSIGNIVISKPFIHADKEYNAGTYWITITDKEGIPYFVVHNQNKEVLFDELAIVKPFNAGKRKFKMQVTKGFLKSQEYYRIKVKQPDKILLAYFLVKTDKDVVNPPQDDEID